MKNPIKKAIKKYQEGDDRHPRQIRMMSGEQREYQKKMRKL